MTKAEVTQIFAVLALAYPSAEMFKAPSKQALEEKLAPTIALWATCLRDIDFWTGQQAVVKVCQTCKYPPSIAEMREAAEAVTKEVNAEIDLSLNMASNLYILRGRETMYEQMSERSRKVVDAMGGLDAFAPPDSKMFNGRGFKQMYEAMLRKNPVGLPVSAGRTKALE